MIDTSAIDPHWPVDAQDAAREQPSLPLEMGETRPDYWPSQSPPPALTLSKSEIGVLRRCPRRYQYEYVLGRTPAAGPGIEAQWGTALHRGLERLYQDMQTCAHAGSPYPPSEIPAVGAAFTPSDDYTPPADPYARAALRAMLRAYAVAWAKDAEQFEVVAVELPFDLPVLTAEGRVSRGRREGARREGRIDAIVREWKRWGDLESMQERTWIVEHKSTGKPPAEDRFYAGIDLDLQSALYFDAARELGYSPAGVLYDVIRRPDFDDPKPAPQLKKDGTPRAQKADVQYTNPRHGEPAAVYEERVYQLAISNPGDFFHRRALTIEPWQIEEAREDVRAAALEIAWRTRSEAWPRVGDRYVCAARGMVCPWIDVCGRRQSAEDDRLFPLKVKSKEQGK